MPLPQLATKRLWVRPLRAEDADDLHDMYADDEAMRYWHLGVSRSFADTERALVLLTHVDAGQFAVGLAGDPTVLGHVGFVNGLEADGHAGFGYGFRRAAWGRGIAAEAARAILGWGFDEVGTPACWPTRDGPVVAGCSSRSDRRPSAARRWST